MENMNNEAQVTISQETLNQLIAKIEKLEKAQQSETAAPMFGGAGLPAPYTPPAKKDSGWATVGKVLLGAGGMAVIWGITSALGGRSGGNDNIFGGSNPM